MSRSDARAVLDAAAKQPVGQHLHHNEQSAGGGTPRRRRKTTPRANDAPHGRPVQARALSAHSQPNQLPGHCPSRPPTHRQAHLRRQDYRLDLSRARGELPLLLQQEPAAGHYHRPVPTSSAQKLSLPAPELRCGVRNASFHS